MKYNRFVYIIRRDDKIKAVLSSRSAALKAFKEMYHAARPAYRPGTMLEDYNNACLHEDLRWHLEKWPVCKIMDI